MVKGCWQCFTASVFVSLCEPHRPDSSSKGDGTVASGEMDGLGDQCKGCEGKAGGEGGEEGGVCLNMQPLWVDGQ